MQILTHDAGNGRKMTLAFGGENLGQKKSGGPTCVVLGGILCRQKPHKLARQIFLVT